MNITHENGSTVLSLEELLDSLGFELWEEILNQFVLPSFNLTSILTCSICAWIFFKKTHVFSDPVFFYFRILSLLYILCSCTNLTMQLCFSPRFLPSFLVNTHFCSILSAICLPLITDLLHVCSVLDICVLLTRMKIFDPFVKKHFTVSPRTICLILVFICLLVEAPICFILKVVSFGDYYYLDYRGAIQYGSYYNNATSDFGLSLLGQLTIVLNYVFGQLFTLIVCVVLNIVSVLKYKLYLRRKKQAAEELRANTNRPARGIHEIRKEESERKAERNMFFMALTLSFISISYRVIIAFGYAYYFVFNTFASNLKVVSGCFTVYTILPLSSIFIFYFFNKLFRQELKRMFSSERETTNLQTLVIRSTRELGNSLGESR